MLFDPKWETTVAPVTKPDIYALPTLIAWLEKQPPEATYRAGEPDICLLGQYARAMGYSDPAHMSCDLDAIRKFAIVALTEPHNFGAALARALAE